jgi:hypothetical protein
MKFLSKILMKEAPIIFFSCKWKPKYYMVIEFVIELGGEWIQNILGIIYFRIFFSSMCAKNDVV